MWAHRPSGSVGSGVHPGESRVEVEYDGAASRTNCLTAVGFYTEALRLLGVEEASVRESACQAEGDELCSYEIRWRAR